MINCVGSKSIQAEINRLARQYPDWPKKITSPQWREQVRKKLLKADPKWCDYRAGTCECNKEPSQ